MGQSTNLDTKRRYSRTSFSKHINNLFIYSKLFRNHNVAIRVDGANHIHSFKWLTANHSRWRHILNTQNVSILFNIHVSCWIFH
ncbi:MAG: hypothetical protein E7077_01535 [Bacteroidales bacterium]|nr:hypothetical protein [Bacteroidales bacterium]